MSVKNVLAKTLIAALGVGLAAACKPKEVDSAPQVTVPAPGVQPTLAPAAPSTPGHFGVVDLGRALAECRAGQLAMARLMAQFKTSQAELDDEQRLLRSQPHPAPDKLAALQQRHLDLQKGLAQAEARETAPLIRGLQETLKTLATERGLDAVIDRAAVPFARVELDLTDELVRRFDAADAGAR